MSDEGRAEQPKPEDEIKPGEELKQWQTAELEKRNINPGQWRVLRDSIYPTATTFNTILMVIDYCHARHMDPFKKPVNIVPMYDKRQSRWVDTVWPGVSELLTTAMRTGEWAGKKQVEFGPTIEMNLGGVDMLFPEWARIDVVRFVRGQECTFEGDPVYWLELYAKKSKDTKRPNNMWERMPFGQLKKCALAASLRVAFPEELGTSYTDDEMFGKEIEPGADVVQSEAALQLPARKSASVVDMASAKVVRTEPEAVVVEPTPEEAAALQEQLANDPGGEVHPMPEPLAQELPEEETEPDPKKEPESGEVDEYVPPAEDGAKCSPGQIREVRALAKKAKLSDEELDRMLEARYRSKVLLQLHDNQVQDLKEQLQAIIGK